MKIRINLARREAVSCLVELLGTRGFRSFQGASLALLSGPLDFAVSCFSERARVARSLHDSPQHSHGGWLVQGLGVGERGVLQHAPVSQASETVSGVPSGPVQEHRPISPLSPNSLPGCNISSLFPQTPSPADDGL